MAETEIEAHEKLLRDAVTDAFDAKNPGAKDMGEYDLDRLLAFTRARAVMDEIATRSCYAQVRDGGSECPKRDDPSWCRQCENRRKATATLDRLIKEAHE